jgi:hypothetical protein
MERERERERSIQGSWSFFDIISSIFLYPTARRPSCCQGLLLLLPRRETLATRRTEEKPTAAAGINTVNNIRRNILDPSMKGAVGFHRDKSVRATDRQTAARKRGSVPLSLPASFLSFFPLLEETTERTRPTLYNAAAAALPAQCCCAVVASGFREEY